MSVGSTAPCSTLYALNPAGSKISRFLDRPATCVKLTDMNSTILLLLLLLFCQGRRFRQQFQLKPDSCHPAKKVLILPEYTWSFPNACWKMCYCLMNPRFCQGLGHNFKKYVWQKHNADVEKSTIPWGVVAAALCFGAVLVCFCFFSVGTGTFDEVKEIINYSK